VGIGIDVCQAEWAVEGITLSDSYGLTVPNKMSAIERFVKALKGCGDGGALVCESSGHYHLALKCHEAGLGLVVLNPLQSSQHAKAKIRKTRRMD
jgi:transposase